MPAGSCPRSHESGAASTPLVQLGGVRQRTIALVGNPNTGKTSLFNALTGYRRRVANYPGVTVDVGSGPLRGADHSIRLLDLPGTYSLAARSPDEAIVCDALCGRVPGHPRPDAILAVVDASNVSRSLYLVSQLREIGLPMVVALNMVDVAAARGIGIDAERLAKRVGAPVIPVVAVQDRTLPPLLAALRTADQQPPPRDPIDLGPEIESAIRTLQSDGQPKASWAEALRLLADERDDQTPTPACAVARARLAAAGVRPALVEVAARQAWVARTLDGVVSRPQQPRVTLSDRIDGILTHRVAGALFLAVTLFVLFQAIFRWSAPLMDAIDGAFGRLAAWVGAWAPEGALQSLIADGVIAGVGGVLVFLPQIVILYAAIAVLEDCGYMARAAYMMDRLMRSFGLSGRAFIPLLSSFACAVPAILGTRTIADRRERYVTILIAPFMSCSARLPVYALLISAFFPATLYLGGWVGMQGIVLFAMYLVGVVAALPIAWLLRRTALHGPPTTFLMELPSYKWPRLRTIWQRVSSAGLDFTVRAGTVILLVNLVVWALAYFPHSDATRAAVMQSATAAGWAEQRTAEELDGAYLRDSFLGRLGQALEPAFRPLGWDWRIGVGVLASFPAREVVIATLGTVYNLGGEVDESSSSLREALRAARWPGTDEPVFTRPVALSIMVFFALCAQCSSTLVMIGRETRSWRWPVASFLGMTGLAYFAAWLTSAIGRILAL